MKEIGRFGGVLLSMTDEGGLRFEIYHKNAISGGDVDSLQARALGATLLEIARSLDAIEPKGKRP